MRKKIIHQAAPAVKISKKLEKRQQFHSLINVLRPKVFITDSSSFKRVVQELTGNGRTPVSSSSPSSSPSSSDLNPSAVLEKVVFPAAVMAEVEDDHGNYNISESSLEDTLSPDHSLELCYQYSLSPFAEEVTQLAHHPVCSVEDAPSPSEYLSTTNQALAYGSVSLEDSFSYGNLEPWLLDMDQYPSYGGCEIEGYQIQQELSVYDYGLSYQS